MGRLYSLREVGYHEGVVTADRPRLVQQVLVGARTQFRRDPQVVEADALPRAQLVGRPEALPRAAPGVAPSTQRQLGVSIETGTARPLSLCGTRPGTSWPSRARCHRPCSRSRSRVCSSLVRPGLEPASIRACCTRLRSESGTIPNCSPTRLLAAFTPRFSGPSTNSSAKQVVSSRSGSGCGHCCTFPFTAFTRPGAVHRCLRRR